jgi:hypothetical protein
LLAQLRDHPAAREVKRAGLQVGRNRCWDGRGSGNLPGVQGGVEPGGSAEVLRGFKM